jgi:ribosome maturation protein Sdo1
MIEISLWLFGKPEWEVNTEKAKPEEIVKLGKELESRLKEAAETLEKLEKNGWERDGGLYDIMLFKDVSKKEAREEMKKLGIKNASINEFEDDEL